METISIKSSEGLQFYNTSNIMRVQAISNYCKIYFVDSSKPLLISKCLIWVEAQLPLGKFWRIHRTHLVNSVHVNKMNTYKKPYLLMSSGEKITVSRRKKLIINKAVKTSHKVQ